MLFYLGTHQPHWLGRTNVPLFVSRRTLCLRKTPPTAFGRWALDSGGFSELSLYGTWTTTPRHYIDEVRRYTETIGRLDWAAAQDWMCEEQILAKTGLTIAEHQRRTVQNYLELRSLAPNLPWTPVLQGWTREDYHACADLYERYGVPLDEEPAVIGVGTMCRRQATNAAVDIIESLVERLGPRIHAFGFKMAGLEKIASRRLAVWSADSLAWSFGARRSPPLPGCTGHKNCANCLRYALLWREKIMDIIKELPRVAA